MMNTKPAREKRIPLSERETLFLMQKAGHSRSLELTFGSHVCLRVTDGNAWALPYLMVCRLQTIEQIIEYGVLH
ncbi:hypothetical protein [Paraburkholderia sp. C35]|uniref:hypothetical protein n=1 Tax=Paraburkholderia sp. C35 TaxID=2126993 RepID=UPI0013A59595|nr:hypothetical protein [Paraburkholderia sp. C35]